VCVRVCVCVCSFRVNHVIVQVSSLKEKQVLREVRTRVWAQARHTVIQKQKKAKKGNVETFRNRRHNTNACVISVHVREETLGHRLEGKYIYS
jgi:hypothetical protein